MDTMYFSWIKDPVQFYDATTRMPEFELVEYQISDCSKNYTTG